MWSKFLSIANWVAADRRLIGAGVLYQMSEQMKSPEPRLCLDTDLVMSETNGTRSTVLQAGLLANG
jgi:hypothetical protein